MLVKLSANASFSEAGNASVKDEAKKKFTDRQSKIPHKLQILMFALHILWSVQYNNASI